MDNQNKNLILASVLSFAVIMGWSLLFPPAEVPAADPAAVQTESMDGNTTLAAPPSATLAPSQSAPAEPTPQALTDLANAPRLKIDSPELEGSISLLGGRIDDLRLKEYRETLDENSPIVTLLKPATEPHAYYALHGWVPGGALGANDVPGALTNWEIESGETLTPESPVTLAWTNATGMTFRRTITLDENFMFNITQSVENNSGAAQRLAPYGLIARHSEPDNLKGFFILHEGIILQTDQELKEIDYDKVVDFDVNPNEATPLELDSVAEHGWIGFTDHYWMTTLVPGEGQPFTAATKYIPGADIYQTETRLPLVEIAPGASHDVTTKLFAGAKEWETIRAYQNDNGIYRFLETIDWGMFFFLTKPMFAVLHWLHSVIGNMGWAIIALTFMVKAALFPLAYKSYVSMARMRELQPEMQKIKERAGDDRAKQQQEIMQLYKSEKVNPASGCLPLILQIPIFFSLYKVIFVTLEVRHQPWLGWIRDLSAPDPSSILNLFGLLSYAAPSPDSLLSFISLGILPILLGVSMWLQQKLNPAPTDATQATIMAWMPWVFMFMLGGFASGLVLYWIANNTLTFIQQYTIMRSHGAKPDLFGNIRSSIARKKPSDET
ncbi:MAG: membrane protein insertase YidC [Maritimibacter sp.]